MKPSDLRIGCTVEQGTIKSFYEYGIHVGGGKCYHFSEVKPAPITEKWLIEHGFKKEEACDWTLIIFDEIEFSISEGYDGKLIVSTICQRNYTALNVDSIHQVQNIYHSLTNGKELKKIEPKVSPEPKIVLDDRFDKNGQLLTKGSVIDIHQTVNGQSRFIVLSLDPLDIRYAFNIDYKYEYDKLELLAPCRFTEESEFEIVGNIFDFLNDD